MKCMNCQAALTDADFCTSCGADVVIYKKIRHLSNACYNEGLEKAKVRDLSGAAESLKLSLKYYKKNIQARNLLGLVYYAQGEVVSALSEWIISKNLENDKNIADQYIEQVQSNQSRLNVLNQTIKKFNVALMYAKQGSEDLAVIQLRKILSVNPTLLKGQQLLALLYMKAEEYEKAAQCLKRAIRIDAANTHTLKMQGELNQHMDKINTTNKNKGKDTIAYQQGNDTIIQPSSMKDNTGVMTIVNILFGLAIGIALSWFLIMPARIQAVKSDTNKDVVKYSDQIAEKDAEISSLRKEIETANAQTEAAKAEAESTAGAVQNYGNLVTLFGAYADPNHDPVEIYNTLSGIDENTLPEEGKALYQTIKENVSTVACKEMYDDGVKAYNTKNYEEAVNLLNNVTALDPEYSGGDAFYYLGHSYEMLEDTEAARINYEQFVERKPRTKRGRSAQKFLDSLAAENGIEE